ncbi:hypothetical protein BDZ89DRAFT_343318 [Hymenopellis radicata]|nr:hypothetical protein BDZ89DRAFT_343318 [Hymenopellis radicata]
MRGVTMSINQACGASACVSVIDSVYHVSSNAAIQAFVFSAFRSCGHHVPKRTTRHRCTASKAYSIKNCTINTQTPACGVESNPSCRRHSRTMGTA